MTTLAAHDIASELGRFVFHALVVAADGDDDLRPREVERLHEIVARPEAATSTAFVAGLTALREQYVDLWRAYQAGQFTRTVESVVAQWSQLQPRLSGEGPQVAAATVALLEDVIRAGSPMLSRLGLQSSAKAKRVSAIRAAIVDTAAAEVAGTGESAPIVATLVVTTTAPTIGASGYWPSAGLRMGQSASWVRGKTRLRCVGVVPETHDVKSFYFTAEPGMLFAYEPGQFMTLELPIEGKVVRRSYTISSSPSRPWNISITVKRVPDGRASGWLHDNMKEGSELSVFGPNGEFTCFAAPAEKMLFIAAGSGITPLMSMLRWLSDTLSPCDVVFLDFVRSTDDVIYRQELAHIAMRMGRKVKIVIVPGEIRPGQPWHGPTGFVSEGMIRQFVPDFTEREVFVCGPGKFMQITRELLVRSGLPEVRYHEESFGGSPAPAVAVAAGAVPAPATPKPPAAVVASAQGQASSPKVTPPARSPQTVAPSQVELVFQRSGKTVRCSMEDLILEVAEANGIAMPSSCRSGTCGTCKTFKVEGEVLLDDQTALSADDLQAGFVLGCVGHGRGRVVLDL